MRASPSRCGGLSRHSRQPAVASCEVQAALCRSAFPFPFLDVFLAGELQGSQSGVCVGFPRPGWWGVRGLLPES